MNVNSWKRYNVTFDNDGFISNDILITPAEYNSYDVLIAAKSKFGRDILKIEELYEFC